MQKLNQNILCLLISEDRGVRRARLIAILAAVVLVCVLFVDPVGALVLSIIVGCSYWVRAIAAASATLLRRVIASQAGASQKDAAETKLWINATNRGVENALRRVLNLTNAIADATYRAVGLADLNLSNRLLPAPVHRRA